MDLLDTGNEQHCSWCRGTGLVCFEHRLPGHNCFGDEVGCHRCDGEGVVDAEPEWVGVIRGSMIHEQISFHSVDPMDLDSRPAFLEACAVLHDHRMHELADELLNLAAMAWHRVDETHRLRLARALMATLRDETSRAVG